MIFVIDQRLVSILLILLKQNDYITINDIANKIDVSNRTVRNDLKLLDSPLQDLNLSLIKKTGMGIKIEGDRKSKLKAYDKLKVKNLNPYPNGPEARIEYMALKLTTVDAYRIYEFADELFVSRASIHKDLKSLKALLNKYHITLLRSSSTGLALQGKEKDIRNMMFDLMVKDDKYQHFLEICQKSNYECNGEFIFYGLDLTDDEIKNFIKKAIGQSIENLNHINLNELSQIIVRLIISFVRISNNKYIELSDSFKQKLSKQAFLEKVNNLVNNIEEAYKLKYTNDEIHYIQLFFLSYLQPKEVFVYNLQEIQAFSNYLINAWSKDLNVDLHHDTKLLDNLLQHLIPVYTRVMHNLPVENQLIGEIKKMYPNTLETVQKSIENSKEWFNMREEDIAFLALHLAAALERLKQPLNCLLIQSDGIGAQILNRQKINRLDNEIKIVQEINYKQIDEVDYDGIDIIISTIELKLDNKIPFLLINNIISDDELLILQDIINSYYKEKNNPKRVD